MLVRLALVVGLLALAGCSESHPTQPTPVIPPPPPPPPPAPTFDPTLWDQLVLRRLRRGVLRDAIEGL